MPCGVGSYAVQGRRGLAGEHVGDVDYRDGVDRTIVLVEGEILRGQVTNWLGQPVAEVRVGEANRSHGLTDEEGFFAIRLDPDEDHHHRFMLPRRTSCVTAPTYDLVAGEPFPESLDIQLPPPEPQEGWWGAAWRSVAMPLLC